jgi:hypothetical protein
VSEILKKSVIGYVEASLDGTKIRYISKENESQPEV